MVDKVEPPQLQRKIIVSLMLAGTGIWRFGRLGRLKNHAYGGVLEAVSENILTSIRHFGVFFKHNNDRQSVLSCGLQPLHLTLPVDRWPAASAQLSHIRSDYGNMTSDRLFSWLLKDDKSPSHANV